MTHCRYWTPAQVCAWAPQTIIQVACRVVAVATTIAGVVATTHLRASTNRRTRNPIASCHMMMTKMKDPEVEGAAAVIKGVGCNNKGVVTMVGIEEDLIIEAEATIYRAVNIIPISEGAVIITGERCSTGASIKLFSIMKHSKAHSFKQIKHNKYCIKHVIIQ